MDWFNITQVVIYTGKLSQYNKTITGWEEVAEGVCQQIMIDFTQAYPSDSANALIRSKGFSHTASKFDLRKNLEWMHGGTFKTDGLSVHDKYKVSAGVAQHLMVADEQFYKSFLKNITQKYNRTLIIE